LGYKKQNGKQKCGQSRWLQQSIKTAIFPNAKETLQNQKKW
jgi:hypothetical protein